MMGSCRFCNEKTISSVTGVFDTRFGIDHSYDVEYCPSCQVEQTTPLPSQQNLKSLYEEHYNFKGETGSFYTHIREWFLFSFWYRLWMLIDGDISFHSIKGCGRLLDVGCNEGRGLSLYEDNGYNVVGLELNDNAASVARSRGFIVHSELLENLQPQKKYDVVVLSNVIEHTLDPAGLLENVYRILCPGGEVWISCPNSRSVLRSIFGRKWINWHVPFHLWHFTAKALFKLLRSAGFETVQLTSYTPSLWASQSLITSLFSRQGKPTLQLRNPVLVIALMVLLRFFFWPIFLVCNYVLKGDCLVIRAYKDN